MPRPHFYRDYPLFALMIVGYLAAAAFWVLGGDHQFIQVTLADECCMVGSCPVRDSLATLGSVRNVVHEASAPGKVISLRASRQVTARQVWEAVEAAQRRPLRVVVDDREFLSKP